MPTINKIAPGAASVIADSAPRMFAVQLVEPVIPFRNKAIPPKIQTKPRTCPIMHKSVPF